MSSLLKTVLSTARTRIPHSQVSISRTIAPRSFLSMYKKPFFDNEPPKTYAKDSTERAELTEAIANLKAKLPIEVPLVVDGQIVASSAEKEKQINPSLHKEIVAEWTPATASHANQAIEAALKVKPSWESTPFEDRAAIFLRAAELVAGKYRSEIVAATMLGQGKNIWQAEIDAAAETCDLLRFYVQNAMDLYATQPAVQPPGSWNRLEYRPLEGFVYAISPFNFTALGANLVGAPALMGNVVIWKPSLSALHSSWLLHKILLEAGLPENVIQFVPGDAEEITSTVLSHRHFAALNFTGSTSVFKSLLGQIGQGTSEDRYLSYPRVVGETGGKNFHLVHSSADIRTAVTNTIRSAFEYQGQKCSAASRIYVSESIWPAFKTSLIQETEKLEVGNPEQYSHFINPVIHARSYDKLASVIETAKSDPELTLLTGGTASNETGYFIHPTIYETSNPIHSLMATELFGPVIAIYVYPDAQFPSIPALINSTSTYALTGSIFARDQTAIRFASDELRHSAGNFYINTKSSGSVVAQQPFGGSRGSGTNDKVGSVNNLMRFTSIRAIKEDSVGTTEVQYPSNKV